MREVESSRFIGPYKVLKHIDSQAYKLALPQFLLKLHDAFCISLLHNKCHGVN